VDRFAHLVLSCGDADESKQETGGKQRFHGWSLSRNIPVEKAKTIYHYVPGRLGTERSPHLLQTVTFASGAGAIASVIFSRHNRQSFAAERYMSNGSCEPGGL
jgi:hypothetical protein